MKADQLLFLEDISPGPFGESGWFELVAEEIKAFSGQWDPFPFHLDDSAANRSVFGGLAASGCHLICISNKLHKELPPLQVMALLDYRVTIPKAGRAGDKLKVIAEIVEARPSVSKTDRGIVREKATLVNQDGETVMTEDSVMLVARRPSS